MTPRERGLGERSGIMPFRITWPECKSAFVVPQLEPGQAVACPTCGRSLQPRQATPGLGPASIFTRPTILPATQPALPPTPTPGAPVVVQPAPQAARPAPTPPATGAFPEPSIKSLNDPYATTPSGSARVPVQEPPRQIIDGRYEVRGTLGKGAFGVVYRARDQKYNREVAVKVLLDKLLDDPKIVQRFLYEAKVLCDITHPNVVTVLGYGRDNQRYYIAFPLIRGRLLKDMIPAGGFEDPKQAVRLIITLVKALHHVHAEHGILHRDIKPANMMVVDDEALYLMDFGLAACQDRTSMTTLGTVMGTPAYMAPEQASGDNRAVCHQSDLYGAGAALFHLLTGTIPFPEKNQMAMLLAIADKKNKAPPPSRLRRSLDPALDEIVLKALEKEPADRYENGQFFAEALQEWLLTKSGSFGRPSRPQPSRPSAPGTQPRKVPGHAAPRRVAVPIVEAAAAFESVGAQDGSTVLPASPGPRPVGTSAVGSQAIPPAPVPAPLTDTAVPGSQSLPGSTTRVGHGFLGGWGLGLVWLVAAGAWIFWAYRVCLTPPVGQGGYTQYAAQRLGANDSTPTLPVYITGATLLLALLVWIIFAGRHYLSKVKK